MVKEAKPTPADAAVQDQRKRSDEDLAARVEALRLTVLTRPDVDDLADYSMLERSDERVKSIEGLMPPSMWADAKLLVLRRYEAEGKEAAVARVSRRQLSRGRRFIAYWKKRIKPETLARAVPWSVVVPLLVVWVATKTWRRPELVVSRATWEVPSSSLDSQNELPNIQAAMGSFWISRFATEMLRDLPSECSTELANGQLSTACITETNARLDKIILSENLELTRLTALDNEVKSWCPGSLTPSGPASARLLYEPDFVSPILEPSPVETPEPDCEHPSAMLRGRRALAGDRIRQYRELVRTIYDQAQWVRRTLEAHLPHGDQFTQVGYVTLSVRNDGGVEAPVNLEHMTLESSGHVCGSAEVVQLDPYSHVPTQTEPRRLLTVPPGAAVSIELRVKCDKAPRDENRWTLRYDGRSLSFSFASKSANS